MPDESKPFCHRCTKGDFACAGYQRNFEFRNSSGGPLTLESPTKTDGAQPIVFQNLGVIDFAALRSQCPPPELSLAAFKDGFCSTFLMTNFVWRTHCHIWLEQAVKGELGPLPRDASFALSMTNFDAAHQLENVKLDGERYRTRTLAAVATGLSEPHMNLRHGGLKKEALIAPILLLILHAVSRMEERMYDEGGSKAYRPQMPNALSPVSHLIGLTHLLLACGPECFQRQPLRSVFESCRTPLVPFSFLIFVFPFL